MFPSFGICQWYGSVVVVMSEQVCAELNTGRQNSSALLGQVVYTKSQSQVCA